MKKILVHLGIFLVASVVGTLYAVMVGMSFVQLPGALIAWPIYVILFWLLFDKFKLLRFVGFVLVPPVLLLGFQFYWSARYPGAVADKYLAYDRSHYIPNTRVKAPAHNPSDPDASGWGVQEVFIGSDGFRADPATERGNPKSCRYVLIGDSMIYGSGLAYADTFGPVLSEMGIEACVFGVTGNSPADYLATLHYVADRIAPGAFVAFYIYAYNDFMILSKYFIRRVRGYSNMFPTLAHWTSRFDQWRRATIVFAWFNAPRAKPALKQWQPPAADGKPITLQAAQYPKLYVKPAPLDGNQRQALKFFFDGVGEIARGRDWRIAMVIHPDYTEVYANLTRGARVLEDLDPRRGEGLEMCKATRFMCQDISRFIYEKTVAEGKNPYFTDDRHFSRFGTRTVAGNFAALAKRANALPGVVQ